MKNPLLFTMILIGLALTAVAQQPNGFYADPNNPYGLSREVLSSPPHLPQVVGAPQAAGLKFDPLHGGILVSDGGPGVNSIQYGNSSRNVAVGPEGNIYAVYYSTFGGIRVARSTNRGESFLPSVQVHGTAYEAEIAVSRNGTVYVAWAAAGIAYVSRSLDGGASFETPVNAGPAFGNNIRAATDGNEVFLVDTRGVSVLSSSNDGQSFDQFNLGASQVFADIHVDRKTGEVIVFADNPTVKYYTSTDRGASFGPPTNPLPGGDVYYSSTAYSSGARGRFAFIAGFPESATSDYLLKINLFNKTSSRITAGPNATPQGRSLAADHHGNVVDAYVASGGRVHFRYSNDLAKSFSDEVVVADGNSASVCINYTNGDILVLYSHNGEIYLSVYDGLLTGYVPASIPLSGLSLAIFFIMVFAFLAGRPACCFRSMQKLYSRS